MKKPLIALIVLTFFFNTSRAQTAVYDTISAILLDRMSNVIGDLKSCSFTLHIARDEADPDFGMLKRYTKHDVYLVGPDKILVDVTGDKGHRGFWYNGKKMFYYSYKEHNYGVMDVAGGVMDAIESLHNKYDIDFPAADFFYPSFTDDMIEHFDKISFLGSEDLDGESCFRIAAKNSEMTVQIWLANDATTLPVKFLITYLDNKHKGQYEGTFSDWKMNPDLPDAMFDFVPPPDASLISILPTTKQ